MKCTAAVRTSMKMTQAQRKGGRQPKGRGGGEVTWEEPQTNTGHARYSRNYRGSAADWSLRAAAEASATHGGARRAEEGAVLVFTAVVIVALENRSGGLERWHSG